MSKVEAIEHPSPWKKADAYFEESLVPMVHNESNIEVKNRVLCVGIYEYFSSHYGTKPSNTCGKTQKKQRHHNREGTEMPL